VGVTRSIGVVVPNLSDPVHASLCSYLEQIAFQKGYQVTIVGSNDRIRLQRKKIEYLLERRVDGLIVTDAHLSNPILSEIDKQGVPLVLALRHADNWDYVGVDDFHGGWLVGEHLCQLGRRKLGLIQGMKYASTSRERARGFAEASAEAGIHIEDDHCLSSGFDVESGYQACRQLLERDPHIDGIFAVSDLLAIGAMGALLATGRSVGSDVALVGYNNLQLAAMLPVPLSSVDVPLELIARSAVVALLGRLAGDGRRETVRHSVSLLARASSGVSAPVFTE
jgi:LacI family transcriptional regulator